MASKRPPIEIADISQNLRESKGQGINAFFSSPQQAPAPAATKQIKAPAPRYPGTPVPRYQGTIVPRYQGGRLRDATRSISIVTNSAY
jgi:hypothetical protein